MIDLAARLDLLSQDVERGGLADCPPALVRLFNSLLKEARVACDDPWLRKITVQKDPVAALTVAVLANQVAATLRSA